MKTDNQEQNETAEMVNDAELQVGDTTVHACGSEVAEFLPAAKCSRCHQGFQLGQTAVIKEFDIYHVRCPSAAATTTEAVATTVVPEPAATAAGGHTIAMSQPTRDPTRGRHVKA